MVAVTLGMALAHSSESTKNLEASVLKKSVFSSASDTRPWESTQEIRYILKLGTGRLNNILQMLLLNILTILATLGDKDYKYKKLEVPSKINYSLAKRRSVEMNLCYEKLGNCQCTYLKLLFSEYETLTQIMMGNLIKFCYKTKTKLNTGKRQDTRTYPELDKFSFNVITILHVLDEVFLTPYLSLIPISPLHPLRTAKQEPVVSSLRVNMIDRTKYQLKGRRLTWQAGVLNNEKIVQFSLMSVEEKKQVQRRMRAKHTKQNLSKRCIAANIRFLKNHSLCNDKNTGLNLTMNHNDKPVVNQHTSISTFQLRTITVFERNNDSPIAIVSRYR